MAPLGWAWERWRGAELKRPPGSRTSLDLALRGCAPTPRPCSLSLAGSHHQRSRHRQHTNNSTRVGVAHAAQGLQLCCRGAGCARGSTPAPPSRDASFSRLAYLVAWLTLRSLCLRAASLLRLGRHKRGQARLPTSPLLRLPPPARRRSPLARACVRRTATGVSATATGTGSETVAREAAAAAAAASTATASTGTAHPRAGGGAVITIRRSRGSSCGSNFRQIFQL